MSAVASTESLGLAFCGSVHSLAVKLQFASHPSGAWTTIADQLPNNGRYDWSVDDRIPAQLYLRLEVHDEAGNVGYHQLEQPIDARGLTPRGHIRGIRPVSGG